MALNSMIRLTVDYIERDRSMKVLQEAIEVVLRPLQNSELKYIVIKTMALSE